MSKKLLYIAPLYRGRSPGQRFRFEQFMPHLTENGYEVTYSNILNENDDKLFYSKGKLWFKLWIGLKGILIRCRDLVRLKKFDVVIVYREAQFLGNTFFERKIAKSKVPMIFDFDDAIWLNDTSAANAKLKWLKKPEKTNKIVQYANVTIVGNKYLKEYALKYSNSVEIIPTCINTDIFKNGKKEVSDTVVIGWTGSLTTLKHLKQAEPVLRELKNKYANKISFLVIGDIFEPFDTVEAEFVKWNKETEIDDLSKIDIGIMPLPNDEWSMGKCGFKGLQYMSLGKPAVMSPIGVNTEIIEHKVNGFLASTNSEWIEYLSELIESAELRKTIGAKGKETVIEKFSVASQKQLFLEIIEKLTS